MAANQVKVLSKALTILSNLYDHSELSMKSLEDLTQLNRSTIFRILQTFIDFGYIEQDPQTKNYHTSLKILEMGGSVLRRMDLLRICRSHLLQLRHETSESTFLAMLDDLNIIVVDWEPSYYDARIIINVGKRVPAYCTGAGKAILAHLPQKEIEYLLDKHPLEKYTENTITKRSDLLMELKETANRGYGVSWEEYNKDIVVVGGPVFNHENRVVAACAVAVLKSRAHGDDFISKMGEMISRSAAAISRELGSTIHKTNNSISL